LSELPSFKEVLEKPATLSKYSEEGITRLISEVTPLLKEEPSLVEVNASNVLFVGDTHGDLPSTISILRDFVSKGYERVIFLGDYVDRGRWQIENLNLVLTLKLEMPDKVVLLRGNHETPLANLYYGFYETVAFRFSRRLYYYYSYLFSQLPYAALVNREFLALHGGLAEGLKTLQQIRDIPKGLIEADEQLVLEILWNDPREGITGFKPSIRGPGIKFFGRDVFKEFMSRNNLKMLIRAHEVFYEGYRYFFDGKLLSIFSARHYGTLINAKVALLEDEKIAVLPVKEVKVEV